MPLLAAPTLSRKALEAALIAWASLSSAAFGQLQKILYPVGTPQFLQACRALENVLG